MKRLIAVFALSVLTLPLVAWGAVNVKSSGVKKAAPVATQKADKIDSVTSLVPTVLGLVGNVKALRTSQEQLTADCVPTDSEIRLVNDLMKEWAKTGETTADSAVKGVGDKPCNKSDKDADNENHYKGFMQNADPNESCYESFSSRTDRDKEMIWLGFPKASKAHICDDVDTKNCKDVSNVYEVFAKITFTDEDYTESEAAKIAQFKAKEQRCSPGKINAAKRELYGNFVTQTLGSVGQTSGVSGTAAVLEAVSSMGGSGNLQSILPSLGTMATQIVDK